MGAKLNERSIIYLNLLQRKRGLHTYRLLIWIYKSQKATRRKNQVKLLNIWEQISNFLFFCKQFFILLLLCLLSYSQLPPLLTQIYSVTSFQSPKPELLQAFICCPDHETNIKPHCCWFDEKTERSQYPAKQALHRFLKRH